MAIDDHFRQVSSERLSDKWLFCDRSCSAWARSFQYLQAHSWGRPTRKRFRHSEKTYELPSDHLAGRRLQVQMCSRCLFASPFRTLKSHLQFNWHRHSAFQLLPFRAWWLIRSLTSWHLAPGLLVGTLRKGRYNCGYRIIPKLWLFTLSAHFLVFDNVYIMPQ